MRILFVTPAPPHVPTDGARLIVNNLAKILARRHELSLVSLVAEPGEASEISAALRPWFSRVRLIPRAQVSRQLRYLASLVDEMPLWARLCSSRELDVALREVNQKHATDVIHFDTGLLAQYADAVKDTPSVIAPHDSMTRVIKEFAHRSRQPLQRVFARWQVPKWQRYEAKYYRRFAACCTVSEREREFLRFLAPSLSVSVVQNGVDTQYYAPRWDIPREHSIGFVGVMDYPPNEDAALFFAREVMPKLWESCPEIRFTLIGRNPTRALRSLTADSRIIVTGLVNDIRPHVWPQSIMVCPVRVRGGIKNKVLESLAMGKALVATPQSSEGLRLEPGTHLLLGDSAEGLARSCLQLLLDPELRSQLEVHAREWASQHTWQETAHGMEQIYLDAIESPRRHSS